MSDAWIIVALREFKPVVWARMTKEQKTKLLELARIKGVEKKSLRAAYREVKCQ